MNLCGFRIRTLLSRCRVSLLVQTEVAIFPWRNSLLVGFSARSSAHRYSLKVIFRLWHLGGNRSTLLESYSPVARRVFFFNGEEFWNCVLGCLFISFHFQVEFRICTCSMTTHSFWTWSAWEQCCSSSRKYGKQGIGAGKWGNDQEKYELCAQLRWWGGLWISGEPCLCILTGPLICTFEIFFLQSASMSLSCSCVWVFNCVWVSLYYVWVIFLNIGLHRFFSKSWQRLL